MARKWMIAAALAASLGAGAALAQVPASIAQAVADKTRPAADSDRDALRKPGEMLAFAGVKPGDKVTDLMMGGGYFTRILAGAVGPKGQVVAYQPAEFIGYQASYGTDQKKVAEAYKNVTPLSTSVMAMNLPAGQDLVLTVQNYHDLHLGAFPKDAAAKVNAGVFQALKPGGVYLVVDHVGVTGSGMDAPNKVHRIDPVIVKQEVEAAGFKLEGESKLLANPADPHTDSVFGGPLKGNTDQFILKFRKPK